MGALTLFGVFGSKKDGNVGPATAVAITTVVCTYVFPQVLVLMFLPPLVGGAFDGYGSIIVFYMLSLAIPVIVAVATTYSPRSRYDDDGAIGGVFISLGGLVLLFVVLGIFSGISNAAQNWGDANSQIKVKYANISVANGYNQMPTTDPAHIVLVTQGIASYEGQQAISSTGQNLGSTFHTDSGQYTLQSISNHLYWVAPLTYNNTQNQAQNADAPGFVMVDAENTNAQAVLVQKDRLGHDVRIHYVIGGFMDRDVYNHIYYHGYMNCRLDDATLEVDDNLTPWYTVTCLDAVPGNSYYTYNIKSVLLLNPNTGAIQSYPVGKQPKWVDRVVSQDMANNLVGDWTRYKYAPWWQGTSQTGQLAKATDPEILYNYTKDPKTGVISDAPVFLYQITSASASDTTSTGFMLYDTQSVKGTYYPLGGVTVGDTVANVFEKAPGNLRNYSVGSVRFYNLYGQPTWVAIYEQTNNYGATFQSVGIVNAQHLDGANVIMADNIGDALSGYQTWLATAGTKVQTGTSASAGASYTGTVTRINQTVESGKTVFYLMLSGSGHVYRVDPTLKGFQPNTEVGDKVRVGYIETQQQVVSLSAFDNLTIDSLATTPTPTPTPTR